MVNFRRHSSMREESGENDPSAPFKSVDGKVVNLRRHGSVSGEIGEIDTSAPFKSVKAAICLFGDVAVNNEKRTRTRSSENVMDKEAQLILAQKELNNLNQKLKRSVTTKSKAMADLDKANLTILVLNNKLTAVREAKQAAIEAEEDMKNRAKKLEEAILQKAVGFEAWKCEIENTRKEYKTTVTELDDSKLELAKIRQDFDAALEAKTCAFMAAAEAQHTMNLNAEKISELSNEIAVIKTSIEELKVATGKAREEQKVVMAEREVQFGCFRTAQEETQKKLVLLKEEYDHEKTLELEAKLAETRSEIDIVREEIKKAKGASEIEAVNSELMEARKILRSILEEENCLRNLINSLRMELEKVKNEQVDIKEKVQIAEDLAAKLTLELRNGRC